MNHTGKDHLPFLESMAKEISQKEWIIDLGVDIDQMNQQCHKKFNILSINPAKNTIK
ncbi:hypothetical protein CIPAW_02G034900 [Carya illinoinensis]|uniref:Uncharacterized protein n=1 Tax=Carya illinoinensis TaxID=32201 RepID=A0A8T1R8W7_CARIL|nr:hypothetical protein CIPAW_02G034900 [Carya illinoinensis]